jgi:outer membrane protein assembly factor BamA
VDTVFATSRPDSVEPLIDWVRNLTPDQVAGYPIRRSATGADRLAFANVEYRFPLPMFSGRVYGAVYVDAGMVYESGDRDETIREMVEAHFKVTPGLGFRVASPLGPMRLDIGYNPYRPQESPQWYGEVLDQSGDVDEYHLVALDNLSGERPERTFFGQFRLHFSVGQAF